MELWGASSADEAAGNDTSACAYLAFDSFDSNNLYIVILFNNRCTPRLKFLKPAIFMTWKSGL